MLRFADLFSGIGGFHLAMARVAGGDCQLSGYSEVDDLCKRVYLKAFNLTEAMPNGDIRELVTGTSEEWGMPQFDLLLGGFPCQPFSNVGKRQGLKDDRSNVFFDLKRVIRYYRPNYFVLENVEKIKTIENGAVLAMLVLELENLDYKVDIQLLNAKDYGLPHQRKRIFFCGRKKKSRKSYRDLPVPAPVNLQDALYPSTWHLLEKAMPVQHIVPTRSRKTIFTRNEKWMGDLEIDRAIARPICATMGKWHRANQDNYFTEHYVFSEGGVKPSHFDYLRDAVRRLTPLEAFRLQGFPDTFNDLYVQMGVAPTPAYRTIGNAVPVNLAAEVISNLINQD
jgi:DNA (cytosine-5)-methyltransferase 1